MGKKFKTFYIISAMIELNSKNFDKIKKGTWIIDFYAEWCGPCKYMEPIFKRVAEKYKDFNFARVDVDRNNELARKFEVMSIPTIIIMRDGKEIERSIGAKSENNFENWIRKSSIH